MTLTISIHGTIEVRSPDDARTITVVDETINAASVSLASNVRLWG